MVKVIASIFTNIGVEGDFGWMLNQPENANAFFIFNDNQSQFEAYQADPTSKKGCAMGGGNAVIRPYQCMSPPRAGGIPTGDYTVKRPDGGYGFPELTPQVKALLDQAVASISTVIAQNGYDTVFYSSDGQGGLGSSIFNPGKDVTDYIVQAIEGLASPK